MGHLIKSAQDFVSYRQPAWHGIGTVLENVMTTKDALQHGGLNFEVRSLPNIHRLPDNTEVISEKSFFTYRTDTNHILGDCVGRSYTILQNYEALNLLDEVVKKGDLLIETAGALNGGAKVFICAKVKTPIVVNGNDENYQYLVLSNGHDGLMSVQAYFTCVRVVCNNTLQLSMKHCRNKISIKHTANVKNNTTKALEILNVIESNQHCAQSGFEHLAKTQLSQRQFFDYIGNLFFEAEEIKNLKTGKPYKDVISTRKQNVVKSVIEYCYEGVGQQDANEMSSWWAYNGITGFFNNTKTYKTPEHRMNSLLWSYDSDTMQTALHLAIEPKLIQKLSIDLSKTAFNLN